MLFGYLNKVSSGPGSRYTLHNHLNKLKLGRSGCSRRQVYVDLSDSTFCRIDRRALQRAISTVKLDSPWPIIRSNRVVLSLGSSLDGKGASGAVSGTSWVRSSGAGCAITAICDLLSQLMNRCTAGRGQPMLPMLNAQGLFSRGVFSWKQSYIPRKFAGLT